MISCRPARVLVLAASLLFPGACDRGPRPSFRAHDTGAPSAPEERALAELRQRAERGDGEAQVALGTLYESGQGGLSTDAAEAAAWYQKAADHGHAGAQVNLAMMHLDGAGVPRDAAKAAAWYQKAAEGGDAAAQFGLGSLFETGAFSLARDEGRAAEWYRRAADQGLGSAQHRLGVLYRDGRGVRPDEEQAIVWLGKAADQGDADAQIELGILLSRDGSSNDVVEAHTWLNLAASRWKNEGQRVRAASLRDNLAQTMTPAQITEAHRRATAWQDAHAWRR